MTTRRRLAAWLMALALGLGASAQAETAPDWPRRFDNADGTQTTLAVAPRRVLSTSVTVSATPVSYTHLEVDKRQGLRAPSDSSLSWNRTSFNTWNLERVEVLKGPSSVLYGQLAPGGMVNQVSKLPTLGEEQVVQLQVDGHGRRQTAFDLGGANGDENVLWRLVGLYGDGATQIKHTDHEQWFIAPSATMYFNDHATRLTLHGLYQKDRGGSTFQSVSYTHL